MSRAIVSSVCDISRVIETSSSCLITPVQGGNYRAWYEAVGDSPRLMAELAGAGHMQFLDVRQVRDERV